MHRHRVVLTGLGQVSALGTDVRAFVDAALHARSGTRRLSVEAPGLESPIGAAIPDFDPRQWMPGRTLAATALTTQYAYAAAAQAFDAARLDRDVRPRGGVFVGTGSGGMATSEETYRSCFTQPGTRPRPTAIPVAMANAAAAFLATEMRLKGPNLTFSVACASGTHAIGQAFRVLRAGDADLMLAGGTDAPLTPIIMAAWNAMKVLAPAGDDPALACRPFRQDRLGLVLGEGAAFFVLETLDHAERRGAAVVAEVVGYGANADAGHITHPDVDGVRDCMRLALEDAGIEPAEVGYINAHGTGTPINDQVEADAIASLFGSHAPRVMVSSTKAVHGHAMGASGALEALATVLAIVEGRIPPTANLTTPDPALPALDLVAGSARQARVAVALSNSLAFGGNNAVLAFRRL
jgi:3-oxoacyl-(acyl-carrier-protein) synthase